MKYESLPELPPDEGRLKLGLVDPSKMPSSYTTTLEAQSRSVSYDWLLEKSTDLLDEDGLADLASDLGVSFKVGQSTLFSSMTKGFPPELTAAELRKKQISAQATGFVSRGVRYYKAGSYQRALQCLNNAANHDSNNVDVLVARGAFFANLGHIQKALADFEAGLALHSEDKNAKKYLCKTLVADAKHKVEDRNFASALASLQKVLEISPESVEGKDRIAALHQKVTDPANEPRCVDDKKN